MPLTWTAPAVEADDRPVVGNADWQEPTALGRAEWLKPYTAETLNALAKKKIARVDVACPGFVSDCLETLEEIAIEAKADFIKAGGKELHYIPCLNERDDWMHALTDIVLKNVLGWTGTATPENLKASKERALKLGAKT